MDRIFSKQSSKLDCLSGVMSRYCYSLGLTVPVRYMILDCRQNVYVTIINIWLEIASH
jgi:hypothetical protein